MVETGRTEESLRQAQLFFFFRNFIEEHDAATQKRHLLHNLRKPGKLHPRDMIARLETVNNYIKLFPTRLEDGLIKPGRPLAEEELITAIIQMIPQGWKTKMLEAGHKIYTWNLQ